MKNRHKDYPGWHIRKTENCWHWWHDDFDGAPDSGDWRAGTAESYQEALEQIRVIVDEY